MTARELYEYALIEINKLEAPSLLLEDYNYFINKAVQQYINKVYNRYDINQQSTDDLRVLKTSTVLPLWKTNIAAQSTSKLLGETFITILPPDYLHMLNCIVEYQLLRHNYKCYDKGDLLQFAARRLSSDMFSGIINNAYMRPTYKRPYYYINNTNDRPTWGGTVDAATVDSLSLPITEDDDVQTIIKSIGTLPSNQTLETEISNNQHSDGITDQESVTNTPIDSLTSAYNRLANSSTVILEIRYGKDSSLFQAQKVYVDYIKAPQYIRLTQTQIDLTDDTSQILEFPDYVCFEIVNEFVKLLMENASDPRLQTNIPINQTIAIPQSQQPQSQASQGGGQ